LDVLHLKSTNAKNVTAAGFANVKSIKVGHTFDRGDGTVGVVRTHADVPEPMFHGLPKHLICLGLYRPSNTATLTTSAVIPGNKMVRDSLTRCTMRDCTSDECLTAQQRFGMLTSQEQGQQAIRDSPNTIGTVPRLRECIQQLAKQNANPQMVITHITIPVQRPGEQGASGGPGRGAGRGVVRTRGDAALQRGGGALQRGGGAGRAGGEGSTREKR